MVAVTDLRKQAIETLTDQQIASRLHIIADDSVRLRKALEENKKMSKALVNEQRTRLLTNRQS